MSERDWSAEFNALPKDVRRIGAALEAKLRIQHLNMEKRRAKEAYRGVCRKCNEHIANCEEWLARLERESEEQP